MSDFLTRIKARLETGQHLNSGFTEDTGWVRAAVVDFDKELGVGEDSAKCAGTSPEHSNGAQSDLPERTQVVAVGTPDSDESPRNSSVLGRSSDSDDVASRIASQTLWETGGLESRIPNGFYSIVPSESMKARFKCIPSVDDLKGFGGEGSSSDVLVVDAREDETLAKLRELVIQSVKSLGENFPAIIKKIAEMVSDFYGGPLFEAGVFKHPADEAPLEARPQLIGQIKVGLCRPRAILFKFLGDAVGLHSRLLMGLQLEDATTSSVICANPNKHLSNIVKLDNVELLVDVMRHPGHIRTISRKALIMYHISGAGDSDSADYDSCDSPLEPNSPLFDFPDRPGSESPDQEHADSSSKVFQRRHPSPITVDPIQSVISQLPVSVEGKLSPSRSEPDLANPFRRRNRRTLMIDDAATIFSPERPLGQHFLRKSDTEGVRSFPSSSPEHPTVRVRAPSMLGGGRRHGVEDADFIGISSPEQSPQHVSTGGKHSPIFRRRSVAATYHKLGERGRRERSLSVDVQGEGFSMDFFKNSSGDFEFPRVNSPDVRRHHRVKSVTNEVGDDVVRAIRAMNEAIKLGRSRSNASSVLESMDAMKHPLASGQQYEGGQVAPALKVINVVKPNLGLLENQSSASSQESITLLDGQERYANDGNTNLKSGTGSSSSEVLTVQDSSAKPLTLRPPAWLKSPLMAFSEWNIDYSELQMGARVGIGSFGEVFRGLWRGTEVAIKLMLEQDMTEENTADFCTEIALLSRLRHPNVILFMGACTTPPHLSLVTEYMHMGSLYSLVHTSGQGKKLSWRRRLKMLIDICRGMMSIQRMNIVHCDLKSANCLVDRHKSVKICDFGLSRLSSGAPVPMTTAAGTPEWMAPELLRNDPVTDKCDIFSLGVIMWELCTLKRPWEGVQPMQVITAVAHKKARLEIPEGLLGKLIADCWAEDPVARPAYDEILTRLHECEFLQG